MTDSIYLAKVPIGRVLVSPLAHGVLTLDDIVTALVRHMDGDWGDVSEAAWQSNDQSLEFGARIFSTYHAANGTKFQIITEWDRSQTAVLLAA